MKPNNTYKKLAQITLLAVITGMSFSCFKKVDSVNPTTPSYGLIMAPMSGPKNTIISISGPNTGNVAFPDVSLISATVNGVAAAVVSSAKNQVQVRVAPGSGTGPVVITLNGTSTTVGTFHYDFTNFLITALNDGSTGNVDGPIESASFDDLRGIAFGPNDKMFTSQYYSPRSRMVDLVADMVTTLAGSGASGPVTGTTGDGTGLAAKMGRTSAVGVSPNGATVYWPDRNDSTIRAVDVATGVVTHLTGKLGYRPEGIKVGASGNIYITGSVITGTNTATAQSWIQKWTSAGTLVWSVKSKNSGGILDQDGDTSTAKFFVRNGIEVNASETMLYFASTKSGNNPYPGSWGQVPESVKILDMTTGTISTLLANSDFGLSNIYSLALDKDGGLWLTDWWNGNVDYYNTNGILRTIINISDSGAGYPNIPGAPGETADQTTANCIDPFGVALTANGDIIYTDDGDGFNMIKRIHPVD
jgi:sugar lactone lactonase YvrE